jgi:hypothetical protein
MTTEAVEKPAEEKVAVDNGAVEEAENDSDTDSDEAPDLEDGEVNADVSQVVYMI